MLFVSLVLGAATTGAIVAISLVLRFTGTDGVAIAEVGMVRWAETSRSRFGATRRAFDRFSARGPGADQNRMWTAVNAVRSGTARVERRESLSRWMNYRERAEIDASPGMIVEDQRGWPWTALRCEWDGTTTAAGERVWWGGRPYRDWKNPTPTIWDARAIPLEPVWPGLIADVSLFAGLWMLALGGWRGVRRVARCWLGRCAACGYDLKGSGGAAAGCPECGWGRARE